MGIELELAILLGRVTLGTSVFAPLGHGAAMVPAGLGAVALTFHVWWCRKNGIDPLRAEPRRGYSELRGWARHDR